MTKKGACEIPRLDRLSVTNEGIYIAVIIENRASEAISVLKSFDPQALIIGEIVKNHPSQVVLNRTVH